jgi:hypothetical protein
MSGSLRRKCVGKFFAEKWKKGKWGKGRWKRGSKGEEESSY